MFAIRGAATAVFIAFVCLVDLQPIKANNSRLRVLRGGDQGIGELVADHLIRSIDGQTVYLRDLAKRNQAVVIAMTSTSCPISKKYFPRLLELSDTYASQNVKFVLVNSTPTDSQRSIDQSQQRLVGGTRYVFDKTGSLAAALGATSTTDALLIDHDGTVVYHGAVDDQYGRGYSRPAPNHTFLADAIDALLAGAKPRIEATTAPGSDLTKQATNKQRARDVTYHNRISRLMNRHCVKCHREGGVGPFRLDTLDDVSAHAPMIGDVVNRGTMPPWFADHKDGSAASPWLNDASMTDSEKSDLLGWINGQQTEGSTADAPEPLDFSRDWEIGDPDVVYEFPRAIPIRATGVMPYKYIEIPTRLNQDRWVEAVEVKPGAIGVVHHILVYAVAPGQQVRNQVNYWAGYVPGNGARVFPESHARLLPRGATLVFQMHYTPNGTATTDKTKIGIRFAENPPEFEVITGSVVNRRFTIPPNAKNVQVSGELRVPVDAAILGFLPHHHLRGMAGRYEAVQPNGIVTLLNVPNYDFNWQLFYQYASPAKFRSGSIIRYTAWYDNSADNPANPNPNVTVRWGPQTEDEMHVGYIEFAVPTGIN